MKAIVVDDELYMLEALEEAVRVSPDIGQVSSFSSCSAALEYAETHPIDIAFLDISMRGIGGLKLAEKLLEMQPHCKVVFCTGYETYAIEAFQLHVSGYLLKPITAQSVQKEIDHIKGDKGKATLLTVRCFGNFEVFYQGEPLIFKRTKTKELLAFLVDRRGAVVTTKQICAKLWEANTDENKNMNYLYQLLDDLRHSLMMVSAEGILNRNRGTYAINVDKLDCDYYRYLESGKPEFLGEYMVQYSWAEETVGALWRKANINEKLL